MSLEMKIPAVGESITEVTIAQWMKADGDFVEMDEVICELESDKATFELNAETSGVLRIKAAEGEDVEIGALVCVIEEGAGNTATEAVPVTASTADAPATTGKTIEMIVPTVGESITEVTVSNWTKADGDFVEMDEIICELNLTKQHLN
jgi:2-oxoglutarate dehydrogenase E2 component (dihydrolipoamide succinyltransferase)